MDTTSRKFKISWHLAFSECTELSFKPKNKSILQEIPNMKFVAVSVFLALCLAVGVESGSLQLPNNGLTLSGNANVQFYGPKEEVWAGLSNGRRYPIINSGDYIALKMAFTSGSRSKYWLRCKRSYCHSYTCPGSVMTSSHWSSCSSYMMFRITAMGKLNGQPINSGDIVSLSSKGYGDSYRLYCATSTSYKCRMNGGPSSLSGNSWFSYIYYTFQIFSRNAVDGTPVQYGDIVGLKYPFSFNSAWLYYNSGYFYARSCSTNSKTSCAATNTYTGFRIFKKL